MNTVIKIAQLSADLEKGVGSNSSTYISSAFLNPKDPSTLSKSINTDSRE